MIMKGLCNFLAREGEVDRIGSLRIGFTTRWTCISSGNVMGEFH